MSGNGTLLRSNWSVQCRVWAKIYVLRARYGNHYATLNGVGCVSRAADVPRAQQFKWTQKYRVSVDVRFNQTNREDVGMLLCADIDFSAPQSGVAQPGSRLIAKYC